MTRGFFGRPTLDVCHDILGKYLIYNTPVGKLAGRIVEVEAYIGESDPACHAATGPTGRSIYLYAKPGIVYIYLIYGFYYCLNFVTEREGFPAAVLIRSLEPVEGVDILRKNSPAKTAERKLTSGPGRLCRAMGLSLKQNGWDMADRHSLLYVEDRHEGRVDIGSSARIGISKGTDKLWRFYLKDSNAVSGRG